MDAPSSLRTRRTALRRKRDRGSHDHDVVYAIIDEALLCHVGFSLDDGPSVVPMLHARKEDQLYLHGARGNQLLRSLARGVPVCVTVTHLDGLVLARSAFHHSVNYRSVMVFGTAREVTDVNEKRVALDALVDRVAPGRAADARAANDDELHSTVVVALPITEASAKIRTGPPIDDDSDLALDVWAGELPVRQVVGPPVPAPDLRADVALPEYLRPDSTVS